MKYLLISSHPYSGSFNAGIAETAEKTVREKGDEFSKIDLVADGFNPVMTAEELKAWAQGTVIDPLAKKYQQEIANADILVFPFPIWWGLMPAVLKGFCDKVLTNGFAYKTDDYGQMAGLLTEKKAIVITTMQTPKDIYNGFFKNPVGGAFIKDTLETCGLKIEKYINIDTIASGGREYAEEKMNEIKNLFE